MPNVDHGIDQLEMADFQRVASFIMSATGIQLPPAKKTMIEGRLRKRARALGLDNVAEYCRVVFDAGGFDAEAINLIDAVTTNKTDFFREPAHFRFLAETALPELAAAGRPGKIWSAACSIGAEPYTIAMVASDFAQGFPDWGFSILASDISTEVLAKAAKGVFQQEMIEPVPLAMRQRYLLRSRDPAKAVVRMAPEIRDLVRFTRINLIDEHYRVDRDMDVIFCRNLLIYFDQPTRETVVRRLCACLRPGGYLILGLTDSTAGMPMPLERLGLSIFRRT